MDRNIYLQNLNKLQVSEFREIQNSRNYNQHMNEFKIKYMQGMKYMKLQKKDCFDDISNIWMNLKAQC